LIIRRVAQAIQELEEKECGGKQYERGYIVAEGSILSVTVVLETRSAGLGLL